MLKWLAGIANDLRTLEADAAPAGWQCLWNRYAAVVFTISNPVAEPFILFHSTTKTNATTHNTQSPQRCHVKRLFHCLSHCTLFRFAFPYFTLDSVRNKMYLQKEQISANICIQRVWNFSILKKMY